VEKLIYVLLGDPGADGPSLGRAMVHESAPALHRRGASHLQVNVVDPELGPPFGVAPDAGTPHLAATLSLWVDAAEGFDVLGALPEPGRGAAWSGYLVTESEPRRNTTEPPGPDGRMPGFAQMVLLGRPDGMPWGEWRRTWQGRHTPVALTTQATFRYVQNVIFRSVTPKAPQYAAVVEECFPTAAASDLHVFFDSVGDEARLARHMAAMSESCDRFMDGASPVTWTAEWLVPDP
jgi:hypothetical protein